MTLLLDDSDLDIAMREADVAIRMHAPRQPELIQRHIASFGWRICGAASYLKTIGIPQRPEDLDAHRLIIYGDYQPPIENINWLAEVGRQLWAEVIVALERSRVIASRSPGVTPHPYRLVQESEVVEAVAPLPARAAIIP